MKNNDKFVKLVIKRDTFAEAEQALVAIREKKHPDFVFWAGNDKNADPSDFLKEIIEINNDTEDVELQLKFLKIKQFFECTHDEAVILYSFTDVWNRLESYKGE